VIGRFSAVRLAWPLAAAAALWATSGVAPEPRQIATAIVHDFELPLDLRVIRATVARGATLASLLERHGIRARDVTAAVARAASVFDVRKLRAAQPYRLLAADGELRRLDYEIDGDRLLRVRRDGDSFEAAVAPIPKRRTLAVVRGAIDRGTPSLFAATEASGETIDLALAMADIFGGEIDFNTELQPGDSFELLVEKQYREHEGTFSGYGPIVAARFENAGRRLEAIRFAPDDGPAAYFDGQGRSMRRFFLRSPLKFDPIVTSAFSLHRLHPVLGEVRAHLGVDYRAPVGAPVIAVADGVVVSAGDSGGAGRMVHLRHSNGYETEYLHLSSIAVHEGQRVRQGDLVGRVGATGLATGPHLDYRVRHDGAFVNPVAVNRAMPPPEPVGAADLAAFERARDQAFAKLGPPDAKAVDAPPDQR